MQTLEVKDRAAWRTWLSENYDTAADIWLVYYRKDTGIPSIGYGASVEEALCYGWVDSIIKRIDEQKYVRKFTPRKPESHWSPPNIRRVEKMIAAGQMTEYGLSLVEAAKQSGSWDNPAVRPELDLTMPEEFARALDENPQAKVTFEALTKTYRKQYLTWIVTAKRPETKARRIEESIRLLAEGKKLGLR